MTGFLYGTSLFYILPRENTDIFYLKQLGWTRGRQLEDGSLRLIPCGKNHSNLLAHVMADAYFIFCPKEVVLEVEKKSGTPEMT